MVSTFNFQHGYFIITYRLRDKNKKKNTKPNIKSEVQINYEINSIENIDGAENLQKLFIRIQYERFDPYI